jgi:hypothetical protein
MKNVYKDRSKKLLTSMIQNLYWISRSLNSAYGKLNTKILFNVINLNHANGAEILITFMKQNLQSTWSTD